MQFIINPKTRIKFSIYSRQGKSILKKYLSHLNGGSKNGCALNKKGNRCVNSEKDDSINCIRNPGKKGKKGRCAKNKKVKPIKKSPVVKKQSPVKPIKKESPVVVSEKYVPCAGRGPGKRCTKKLIKEQGCVYIKATKAKKLGLKKHNK